MVIHLCIESSNGELLEETLNSIKECSGRVTYHTYSRTFLGLKVLWEAVSLLANDTYLLFLKEGDKLMSLDFLNILSTDVDLYLLLNNRDDSYPNIGMSPFALSNFYEGKYNNYNFLIKAKQLNSIKPNLAFGKAWVMDVVLSALYVNNAFARDVYGVILAPNSPSLADTVGDSEMILKVIPAKYGYCLSDMLLIKVSEAKGRYKKIVKRKIREARMKMRALWIKRFIYPEVYKQFYRVATFKSKYAGDWNQIPIIINNFNRLHYLTQLIDSLEKRGVKNIHILDNNSTYVTLKK